MIRILSALTLALPMVLRILLTRWMIPISVAEKMSIRSRIRFRFESYKKRDCC